MTTKKNKETNRKLLFILLDSVTLLGSIVSRSFKSVITASKSAFNLLIQKVKKLTSSSIKQLTKLAYVFTPVAWGVSAAFVIYMLFSFASQLIAPSAIMAKKPILIFDRNNNLLYKTYMQDLLQNPTHISPAYKRAPYAVDYTLSKLMESFAEHVRSGKSLRVKTTIDLGIQNLTQQKILEQIDVSTNKKLSLSVINPTSGEILAMVNSPNYYDEPNISLDLKRFQEFELQSQVSAVSANSGKYVDIAPFIEITDESGRILFSQNNKPFQQILISLINQITFFIGSNSKTNVLTFKISPSLIFSSIEGEPISQSLLESISKELITKRHDKKLSKEFK